MKLTGEYKNHYLIIGTALAIIAVWYFFFKKKDTKEISNESGFNIQGANDWIINCIGQQQASNPDAFNLAESTQLCSRSYNNKRKVKITKNQAVN